MDSFRLRRLIFLLILLAAAVCPAAAQEKVYKGVILDQANNRYSLTELTVSGGTLLRCRLKDTVFTLDLEKIRSLTVNAQTESPYPGYVPATVALAAGGIAQAYVDLENYWLEGVETNFNVRIKIKLADVRRLDLSLEIKPPAPSPTPSPSPSPASAPTY